MDGRRRRWFAMSADFPFDTAGTRLLDEYGPAGLAVWVCYLAACKRSAIPGRIQYTTDSEAWQTLGFADHDPPFDLNEFWTFTGRLKLTRRTSRGRVQNVAATGWERWQNPNRTRIRQPENTTTTPQNSRLDAVTLSALDSDLDSDKDKDSRSGRLAAIRTALRQRHGTPITINQRTQEASLLVALADTNATPAQIVAGEYDDLIGGT